MLRAPRCAVYVPKRARRQHSAGHAQLGETSRRPASALLGTDHPDTLPPATTSPRLPGRGPHHRGHHPARAQPRRPQAHPRTRPPPHPELRNNLAAAYQDAGRTDEAITLHQPTLADCERALGPDHPDTLTSRNNLALAYQDAGRTPDAAALMAEPDEDARG